jgi:hypothetical protein
MLGAGIFGTLLLCAAVPAAALVTIQDYTVFSGCGGSSPCPACLAFTTDNAKSDCPILFDGHYGFKGFNQGAAEVTFSTVGYTDVAISFNFAGIYTASTINSMNLLPPIS